MMEIGGEFFFEGNVSKSVLDNLEMFCKIWQIWYPEKYKPIIIYANEVSDLYRPDNNKALSTFSGGLDAAYTAYKYKHNLAGRLQYCLDKSIMIHGADIPIKEERQFNIAYKNAKIMMDDLNIELIPVLTNFREIFDSNWEHCFATLIVSTLNFFSKNFSTGIMASGYSVHSDRTKWGQNPVTDKYLSNDSFKFIVDGYEHTRTERAGFIKNWNAGLTNLRVCWINDDKSKNCGICEKCVRTKLNFKANQISHLPSMPNDFSIKDLENLEITRKHLVLYYKEIYDYAKINNSMSYDDLTILKTYIDNWMKNLNRASKNKRFNIENILSIKNSVDSKHKQITILGIKINIKRKKLAVER